MLCCRVLNLLSAYFDQELTGAQMLEIRRHLNGCPSCRAEHDSVQKVKTLFAALGPVEPPRPLNLNLLQNPPRRSRVPVQVSDALARVGAWMAAAPRSSAHLATYSALALVIMALAVVHHPQHADAVTANVPELLPAEETAPATAGLLAEPDGYFVAHPATAPYAHRTYELGGYPQSLGPVLLVQYDSVTPRSR